MIDAFLVAFAMIFVAELGDKSQLMTLAFATRYRWWVVLFGVAMAALLVLGASVVLGTVFAAILPTAAIQVLAGLAFLAFAAWTVRSGAEAETAEMGGKSRGMALLAVTGAFIVAELGDKTMLATLTLAATNDALGTWLGASAGMVSANVAAVAVGAVLGTRLPQRPIRVVAAIAFAIFGLLLLAEGLGLF